MPNAHGSLVNACIALINARGGYAFKVQSGVLPVQGRFVHAGKPGVPDVVGVWPMVGADRKCDDATCEFSWLGPPHYHHAQVGRMIAVECKTGTGRLSKVQRQVHDELTKRGALVLTVRNIAELEKALA